MDRQDELQTGEEGVQHLHTNGEPEDPPQQPQHERKSAEEDRDPTNLIINYIPMTVTEEHLRLLFSPYGSIERCKIVMDKFTGGSLGYGFVKYDNPSSAVAAIAALNGQQLANKRLKVSISRPPDRDKKTNLYISGLPLSYSQHELQQLVSLYGPVQEVRLLLDSHTRKCKGVGFAKFETSIAALACIAALTGTTLDGSVMPLIVKFADTTGDKVRKAMAGAGGYGAAMGAAGGGGEGGGGISPLLANVLAAHQYNRQFQQQQPHSADAALAAMAQQRVAEVRAGGMVGGPYDPHAAAATAFISNGFYQQGLNAMNGGGPAGGMFAPAPRGHVGTHAHQSQHQLASAPHTPVLTSIESLSPPSSDNHPSSSSSSSSSLLIDTSSHVLSPSSSNSSLSSSSSSSSLNSALPPQPSLQSEFTGVCLFVYHLPLEATEATLFQLFGHYGIVTSAKVMRDLLTGRSKGYGFVNIMTEGQAQAAIAGLNGFQLGSKYLKVAYKK